MEVKLDPLENNSSLFYSAQAAEKLNFSFYSVGYGSERVYGFHYPNGEADPGRYSSYPEAVKAAHLTVLAQVTTSEVNLDERLGL